MGKPKKAKAPQRRLKPREYIKVVLERVKNALKLSFFPEGYVCIGCKAELNDKERYLSLCPKCQEQLSFRTGSVCDVCGNYIEDGVRCKRCQTAQPAFDAAYSVYDYGGLVRRIVISHKDRGESWLGVYMARHLLAYYGAMEIDASAVAYVPSAQNSLKRRGYEHNKLVAETFAKGTLMPLLEPIVRVEGGRDQSSLGYEERLYAVKDSFKPDETFDPELIKDRHILLIDDVMTTGATAAACAAVLKKSGASRVTVLTFAR